jgi:uroporphyrinogen-III synthase
LAEPAVLVTRPAGQSRPLGERLLQAGFRPVYAPLLEIQPFDEPDASQRQLLLDLCNFEHVVFVSSNAIRYGMEWIEDFWPQLPTGIRWYTVGSGSAAELESFGIVVLLPEKNMSSEGLLELPTLSQVQGERVLIVKGEAGREHLRSTLELRGGRVDELVVYRRGCPAYLEGELAAHIVGEGVEYILVSSGEGLNNMVSLLRDEALESIRRRTLVVPGERIAELARDAGFDELILAENATDQAMLAALMAHCHTSGDDGDTGER